MKIILLCFLLFITGCSSPEENTNQIVDANDDHEYISKTEFPVDNYTVFQGFAEANPGFDYKYHCADDVFASAGTPVKSMADGTVSYSGSMGGYGWLITIDHEEDSVYSLYGHLSTKRGKVSTGDKVKSGQVIAYVADDDEDGSGPIDGSGQYIYWTPHLHFSVRKGKISDFPSGEDDRWMAGYTRLHPTKFGWLNPLEYINSKK